MPSHIYVRTGDYVAAAQSNAEAIVVDRDYIAKTGARGVYPMMYYNHNIHFLASAHGMNGRASDAIKAARELEANVKPHLKAMPMLEMFAPYVSITLVRFRRWDEILKEPQPAPELKITTALWHFARGMAHAGKGQAANAETELKALRDVAATVAADAGMGNSTARGVLQVAEQMLAGKIALARGDKQAAVASLRKAVEAEDALNYNEPADWDIPARESLGGAARERRQCGGREGLPCRIIETPAQRPRAVRSHREPQAAGQADFRSDGAKRIRQGVGEGRHEIERRRFVRIKGDCDSQDEPSRAAFATG
jgi:hypothetical protein